MESRFIKLSDQAPGLLIPKKKFSLPRPALHRVNQKPVRHAAAFSDDNRCAEEG